MKYRSPVAVVAAQFWTGSTGAGVADGLRKLGWLVQEIDIRAYTGQSGASRVARLAGRAHARFAIESYRNRVREDCQLLRPDLFLTVKGVGLTSQLIRDIKLTGCVTANYYPDVDFSHANLDSESIIDYDFFLTTKSFHLPWLSAKRPHGGNHYIPHGYCETVHRPLYSFVGDDAYLCDVAFAGNHSAHKAEQLGQLLSHLPELDLQVTGPNWLKMADWPEVSARVDRFERRNLAFADFNQRSKINLAFHHGKTSSGWFDLVSTRSFELPACRGFMLHVDNEEIREFFDVGHEIDTFSSVDELADKIRFYLARPKLREQMIDRAYERTVPAYSYTRRASEILQTVGLNTLSASSQNSS